VAILGYKCAGYTVDKSTPTTTSQIDWHIPHLQAYSYFAVVVVGESVMQNLCMLTADKTRTKESYWVLKTRQLLPVHGLHPYNPPSHHWEQRHLGLCFTSQGPVGFSTCKFRLSIRTQYWTLHERCPPYLQGRKQAMERFPQ